MAVISDMDPEARRAWIEQRRRDWVAKFPMELREQAEGVYDLRTVAVRRITAKNRAQMYFPYDPRTPELVRLTEETKEATKRAEEELQKALLAYKTRLETG